MTYMFLEEDTDKYSYLMKNSLQTVLGFYLKTLVKTSGTLPLTSLGPKYYSPICHHFKPVYILQRVLSAWSLPLKLLEQNWRNQLN